jgi:hypothetical protein
VAGGAGWVVVAAVVGANSVILVSFRRTVTPDRLLGRTTASFRFLLTGAPAVGVAAAGVIGQALSPRAALAAGAVAIALVQVPILASPLRKARDLEGWGANGQPVLRRDFTSPTLSLSLVKRFTSSSRELVKIFTRYGLGMPNQQRRREDP